MFRIFLFLVGIIVIAGGTRQLIQSLQTIHWESVTGTIKESYIEEELKDTSDSNSIHHVHPDNPYAYHPVNVYRYQVAGDEYVSKRMYAVGSGESYSSEEEAREKLLPKNHELTVLYDPNHPQNACIYDNKKEMKKFSIYAICGGVFLLFAAYAISVFFKKSW